jgi:hypothetical protein
VQTTLHIKNGQFDKMITLAKKFSSADQNYQDVSVIAFPTPKGDDQPVLLPASIESNNKNIPWKKILNPEGSLDLSGKNSRGIMGNNNDRNIAKVKGQDTYVQIRFDQPSTHEILENHPSTLDRA